MEEEIKPQNLSEKLIWYAIIWTYGIYLIGGLYVVGAVLAWILFFILCKKLWDQDEENDTATMITIPWVTWTWIIGMVVMEAALIMGHLDYDLGLGKLIKSSIGWAKGWALLALYPLAGCLPIRPKLMYRAASIVCAFTLIAAVVGQLAYYAHLPERLYVSPLKAVGGPGPEFFEVRLYEIDPGEGKPRWRLFTPWAPGLGFVANTYFFMVLQEQSRKWRYLGIAGCVCMCFISSSRLALLAMPTVWIATFFLARVSRPVTLFLMAIASFVGGILAPQIILGLQTFEEKFTSARKDSSRVRATLGRIALERWQNEAPVWGHGIVEGGPHLVEYMPIGSHHSWFGLLFVKGIVGLFALAIPLFCSFVDLLIKSQNSEAAKVGLAITLVLFMYTFGENLEILAYLFWPGMVMMGIAFKGEHQGEEKKEENLV